MLVQSKSADSLAFGEANTSRLHTSASARQLHTPDVFASRPQRQSAQTTHAHAFGAAAPVDMTRANKARFVALRTAIANDDTVRFNALVALTPQLDGVDRLSGKTLTHIAVERHRTDMLATLLTRGAPLNVCDRRCGRTPLHAALHVEDAAAVKLLLEHGADTEIHDYNGYTPLQSAVEDCKPELESMLRDHGANGQADSIVMHPRVLGLDGRPRFVRVVSADIMAEQRLASTLDVNKS